MNYFKDEETNIVYAFDDEQLKLDLIIKRMKTLKKMTRLEIDQHINPQKYLSDEERHIEFVNSLVPLERRQFKLAALEAELIDNLEDAIDSISDRKLKRRISIVYSESERLERTGEEVKIMLFELLGLTEEQVNEFWIKAMAL